MAPEDTEIAEAIARRRRVDDRAPRASRRPGHDPRARRRPGRPSCGRRCRARARAGRRADGRRGAARPPGRVAVRLGRRRQVQRRGDLGAGPSQRRAQPDPERPHRRREPRAEVAVGPRPFTAHVEDDWLYGRGAADMKCGLAAILGAVKGLRELGLTPHAPVHRAVGRRGGVHGQRRAADAARRVSRRRGDHRRAVRRRDHHVAGRRALVRRRDRGLARPRGRGGQRGQRDRGEPAR